MKKIVLFGGAFNPPHLGHLIIIQQAFELIPKIAQLWVLPCYQHTFQKELVSAKHRLHLAQLLIEQLPPILINKVRLETIEHDYQLSGETYEALQLLKKQYSQHQFVFLMGSDQLKSFKKWGNWQKLLKAIPFYVYPRSGYQNHINFPNMQLLKSETQVITNLSSTLIRKRVGEKLPLTNLAPKTIINYLKKHQLYTLR